MSKQAAQAKQSEAIEEQAKAAAPAVPAPTQEPTQEQIAEAGAEAEKALKELERQGGNDSTLSRYFRQMAG
ncbi:MAG: hypothetical protein ACPGUV_07555, partial [Polyangiales bacterium]